MIKKILIFSVMICAYVFAQVGDPSISVAPMDYNFGTVKQGKLVEYKFTITNTGNSLLKITNVKASCGCTAAKPEKSELKPNESTKLKVEFNSEGRKGNQTKYIYITSNDPKNPDVRLKITGVIEEGKAEDKKSTSSGPKLQLKEEQHNFGVVKEGKVVDYTFKFINSGMSTLEIKDVKTSCGCTAALISNKNIEPGKDGTIRVELDTKNRVGKMTRNVSISSNDPEEPIKVITIYAEVEKEKN